MCQIAQHHSWIRVITPQTQDFKSLKAKHLTTVHAALALTFTSLPKAMRFPAFLAGLWRVLIMQTLGMVNFPVPLISFVTNSANASKAFVMSDLFLSQAAAKASAMAPLAMDFTPFIAFIPLFIAFLPILIEYLGMQCNKK